MQLQYKSDWEETKEHYRAWWAHEYFGRAALAVAAPLDNPPNRPIPPEPATVHERWYDLDAISARIDYEMSGTFYGGEAFPIWYPGYPGISSIPSILGCKLDLDMHTGWSHPILPDPDGFEVHDLELDTENPGYVYAMDVLERAVRETRGKSIPSIGAFGGGGDTLAALRDTRQLLFDCTERPDAVREAELLLMDMWCDFYDRCHAVTREASDGGSVCWFGVWSPGKTYAAHNDFSYNISPAMFRDFMLPRYRRITDLVRARGCDTIFVDSDGDVSQLIPLWLEAGINGVYPMEVAAGMDVGRLRQEYGRDLLMTGGIDKRALAQGPQAIDAELKRRMPVAEQGGYVPHLDHAVPHDVPYEAFCYYWDRKKEYLGIGA